MTTITLRPVKEKLKPGSVYKTTKKAVTGLNLALVSDSPTVAPPVGVSAVRLALVMAAAAGRGAVLTMQSVYWWASGPPMTERDRTRLNISSDIGFWKYWCL